MSTAAPGDESPERTGSPSHKVGYRKPPVHSRFVKGQSGNPRGPKKAKRVEDIGGLLNDILDEEISVRAGKHDRRMTRLEAMFHAQKVNALRGDNKAKLTLMRIANKSGFLNPPRPYESNLILTKPDGDQARILRVFRREQAALKLKAFGIQTDPNGEA